LGWSFVKPNQGKEKIVAKKINSKSSGISTKQTFAITAPGAVSVQLMGDFTHWQKNPISMEKGARGVWQTTVELAPGTHHYRFFVDGEWHDDPECTLRAPNPYGGENMIRQVKASATA
jgi:1,4-alpha-glucan branching enzyme